VNVSKDPETGIRNVGVYRMELLGPRQATVSTNSGSHFGIHVAKAEQQGRPLEMAVAIGTSEAVVMAGSAAYPYGVDEYELAGGLQQESVKLIQCQTVNLEVPADSEIVIEGVIKPGVRVQDGPYFDYVGKPSVNPRAFLFEATRVMSRRHPIFRGASIGAPGAEDQHLLAALASIDLWDFHGSRAKRWLQSYLLRNEFFKAFQLAGRMRLH
jgi:4-hydroxy-3-polyprenylbenzoate decarboxylase